MGLDWLVFVLAFTGCISVEVWLSRRKGEFTMRLATIMTVAYFAVAMAFGGYIAYSMGADSYMEFTTGYVMELALSVDNLFVIGVIMGAFAVPKEQRRKLLFFGLIGAVLLRGLFVFLGIGVIERFSFVLPLMGLLLVFLGLKVGFEKQIDEAKAKRREKRGLPEPSEVPWMVRLMMKWGLPAFVGALVAIEVSDLIFAVDSVPVILAITQEPLIALSSSMLAVVGLRSLYFLLEGAEERFEYLGTAIGLILAFIGIKLVLPLWHIHVPMVLALGVTVSLLACAIGATLWKERKEARKSS